MHGLMMDRPLLVSALLEHAERFHPEREVVSATFEGGLHRSTWGELASRARRLAARKRPMWVRFVLVPGLTDDAQSLEEIAKFAAGLGNVERVEVLPFHQMGRYKWKELGINYAIENTEAPSSNLIMRTIDRFRAAGLKAY